MAKKKKLYEAPQFDGLVITPMTVIALSVETNPNGTLDNLGYDAGAGAFDE